VSRQIATRRVGDRNDELATASLDDTLDRTRVTVAHVVTDDVDEAISNLMQ
jgi:hypothetical protein